MEMSVSSETTFFNMKLQLEICPQLRTGSSAEDRGRIDTREYTNQILTHFMGDTCTVCGHYSVLCLWPLLRIVSTHVPFCGHSYKRVLFVATTMNSLHSVLHQCSSVYFN